MSRVKVRKTVSLVDLSTSTKLFIDNYNYQINKRNKIDNKAYIYSGVCCAILLFNVKYVDFIYIANILCKNCYGAVVATVDLSIILAIVILAICCLKSGLYLLKPQGYSEIDIAFLLNKAKECHFLKIEKSLNNTIETNEKINQSHMMKVNRMIKQLGVLFALTAVHFVTHQLMAFA